MLDLLIILGGIGGTYNLVSGVYYLLTGQTPQRGFTVGELVGSGVVGLVVGYQAWKFKRKRSSAAP